jgi:hypothetical protein
MAIRTLTPLRAGTGPRVGHRRGQESEGSGETGRVRRGPTQQSWLPNQLMDAQSPASYPTRTTTLEKREAGMTKIRRNGPCPCGSASKAKRCCHGNDKASEIYHHLSARICRAVIPVLSRLEEDQTRALFEELHYLPEIDTSLQLDLGIITLDMNRAIDAIDNNDNDEFVQAAIKVVASVDSLGRRLTLAQNSTLLFSSVAESLAAIARPAGFSRAANGRLHY